MAMTAAVKDELSRVDVPKPCCRRSEMAALLRFSGGLHIVSGRVVVEAELDTGSVARRLRREIAEVYGYPSEIHVLASGGLRKGSHYIVRVVKDGEALARQTGLLDVRGRPVRGLPSHVVSANACCAVAAWRGAFLAHGSLTEPGRSCALEITCPGPESALALVRGPRRAGPPAGGGGPARGENAGLVGERGPAAAPATDQGRDRGPDPAPARVGRQAGARPGHPRHRVRGHRRDASELTSPPGLAPCPLI